MKNSTAIITPLPEAFDGRKWAVKNGPGAVDLTSNEMFIPTGNTYADQFVRLHEMGHARWTPKSASEKLAHKHGISLEALQVCEDARIHAKLGKLNSIGREKMTGVLTDQTAKAYIEYALKTRNPARELARILTGSWGTSDSARIRRAISDYDIKDKETHEAHRLMNEVDEAHNVIREHYSSATLRRNAKLDFKKTTLPAAQMFDRLFPVNPEKMDDCKLDKFRKKLMRQGKFKHVPWAELDGPVNPALTKNYNARKLGASHRATDSGAILRNLHRLPVDGAIFSTRKKIVGGALLLDASGSMDIQSGAIEKFLESVPHGIVAIYAGMKSRNRGTLAIIAKAGRMLDAEGIERLRSKIGRHNLVDGPALRWLAKQSGKKVWVSDGIVTGSEEKVGENLPLECDQICRAAGIERFDAVHEAVNAFTGSRR